jgi:hypothetical protein
MTPEERFTKIENALQALTETQVRHELAIRDLITVSRTILDSQKEMSVQILELRDGQKHTDEKLNALIDTVDRIIRNRNGDGHKA